MKRHMKDPGNLEAFHRLGSTRSNTTVLDSSMGTRTTVVSRLSRIVATVATVSFVITHHYGSLTEHVRRDNA